MKNKELRDLRVKEVKVLKENIAEKKFQLSKIFTEIKTSKEKDLKKGRKLRKDIAQLLTILREKDIVEKEKGGQNKL